MPAGKFDGDAFFAALDAQRIARKLTWKKVAEQSDVPASTLTRMSQGRRPDVDSLAALCEWSGLQSEDFVNSPKKKKSKPESLAMITAHFRADPNLSEEAAKALETLLKTAYQQLRK